MISLRTHTSINHEDRLTLSIFVQPTIRRCELAYLGTWSRLTAGCSACHRVISHHGQEKQDWQCIPSKYSAYRITTVEGIPPGVEVGGSKTRGPQLSCAKTTPLQCGTAKALGCRLQVAAARLAGGWRVLRVRVRGSNNKPARTNGHPPTHPSINRPSGETPLSTKGNFVLYVWHLLACLQKCSEAIVLEPLPDRTSRPLHKSSFPAQLVPSSQTGRLIIPSLADTWCNATPLVSRNLLSERFWPKWCLFGISVSGRADWQTGWARDLLENHETGHRHRFAQERVKHL